MIRLKNLLTENVKDSSFIERLKKYENSKGNPHGGWDKQTQKWFPHPSPEGGTDTIAYGHKLKSNSEYQNGITDEEALKLLYQDIDNAVNKIKNTLKISQFDSFPDTVQQALVNATYRGELKSTHKTVQYIKSGTWDKVSDEYLDNAEYRAGSTGLQARMNWNAQQFRNYAERLNLDSLTNNDIKISASVVEPGQEITIQLIDPSKLTKKTVVARIYNVSGKLIKSHRWDNIERGVLQFNAPNDVGTYLVNLNQSTTLKITVQK